MPGLNFFGDLMKSRFNKLAVLLLPLLIAAALASAGQELPVFHIAMKDGKFVPAELKVPAGRKFKLIVSNEGDQPSEFESFRLHREQVVVAHGEAALFLGPLKTGTYDVFDDFHPGVKGSIEAVEGL
jgi:hypothetical protein